MSWRNGIPLKLNRVWRSILASALFAAVACQTSPWREPASSPASLTSQSNVADAPRVLDYEVELMADFQLHVIATFPPQTPGDFSVEPPAMPFVRDLRLLGGQAQTISSDASLNNRLRQFEEVCWQEGCQLAYTFALDEAADVLDDRLVVGRMAESILAPSSSWLLRPRNVSTGFMQRYRVKTPVELHFASGTLRSSSHPSTYEAPLARGFFAPYAAFGPLRSTRLSLQGANVQVHWLFAAPDKREPATLAWIQDSARAVAHYYGSFPSETAAIFVSNRSYHGSQMGIGGASVILGMGSSDPRLGSSAWVATHEMVHIGFPAVPRSQRWATEGLATYVETLARSQTGLIDRDELWSIFLRRLPLGNPAPGDRGLDRTPTWARIYWGGALFWFACDLDVLRATNGSKSLKDAVRGLVAAGGNGAERWSLDEIVQQMDDATGTHVFSELYLQHARAPVKVDLERVFASLGVSLKDGKVVYNDDAPDAALRGVIDGH